MRAGTRSSSSGSLAHVSRTLSQAANGSSSTGRAVGHLDRALHAHAQHAVRAMQAEVGDAVAEAVGRVVPLVGRRVDLDRTRQQPLPRQVARRQARELPRLRHRRGVDVARLVLDGVALTAGCHWLGSAFARAHATSDSTLRDSACEKNLSVSSSDTARGASCSCSSSCGQRRALGVQVGRRERPQRGVHRRQHVAGKAAVAHARACRRTRPGP